MGAWIETSSSPDVCSCSSVAPFMERGLKPRSINARDAFCKSLPSWERGLKPLDCALGADQT